MHPARASRFRVLSRARHEGSRSTQIGYRPGATRASTATATAIATALNSRPRKALGWKTPAEAMNDYLLSHQTTGVATIV
jgi:hypothetical protein